MSNNKPASLRESKWPLHEWLLSLDEIKAQQILNTEQNILFKRLMNLIGKKKILKQKVQSNMQE